MIVSAASVPSELAGELSAYQLAFGHAVPTEVVQLYAARPGPLVMEIRQAVAMRKPVRAWLAKSKIPAAASPPSEWYPRMPR